MRKENKKRFGFMILVVVMIMSMASTAFAGYSYQGSYTEATYTKGSVQINTYIRDRNEYNKVFMPAGSSYVNVSYTSQAYVNIPEPWYQHPEEVPGYSIRDHELNSSGGVVTFQMSKYAGHRGKLRFENTQVVDRYCIIKGTMH